MGKITIPSLLPKRPVAATEERLPRRFTSIAFQPQSSYFNLEPSKSNNYNECGNVGKQEVAVPHRVISSPIPAVRVGQQLLHRNSKHSHGIETHLISVQDLGDTSMGHPKLTGDNAGTDSRGRHLDDLQADMVRKRSPVDEDASQLIYTSLTGGHVT